MQVLRGAVETGRKNNALGDNDMHSGDPLHALVPLHYAMSNNFKALASEVASTTDRLREEYCLNSSSEQMRVEADKFLRCIFDRIAVEDQMESPVSKWFQSHLQLLDASTKAAQVQASAGIRGAGEMLTAGVKSESVTHAGALVSQSEPTTEACRVAWGSDTQSRGNSTATLSDCTVNAPRPSSTPVQSTRDDAVAAPPTLQAGASSDSVEEPGSDLVSDSKAAVVGVLQVVRKLVHAVAGAVVQDETS